MMSFNRYYHRLIQPLLVIGILALGILGAISFSLSKDEAPDTQREDYAPLVRTLHSTASEQVVTLHGYGTLAAHTRLELALEVSGRVTYVHPQLRAGGQLEPGELLIQLEQRDYKLAVIQAEADVTSATTALELEQAEALSAAEEWQEFNPQTPIPLLVSRQPQIAQAEATLKAAQANLATAQLNLERTQLHMPYAGRIVSANISVGSLVSANQQLGELYKRDRFEIPVPFAIDELAWISPRTTAEVIVNIGEQAHRFRAQVSRLNSELDAHTRQGQAIITLLTKEIPAQIQAQVIPGLFVQVAITSQVQGKLHRLPRSSLRDNNHLWTVVDKQLSILQPTIVRQTASQLLVSGLPESVEVITSHLDIATEGMQVRPMGAI